MKRVRIKIEFSLPLYVSWHGWLPMFVWPAKLRRQCKTVGFDDAATASVMNWYFPDLRR